jgi:hypothetical protein
MTRQVTTAVPALQIIMEILSWDWIMLALYDGWLESKHSRAFQDDMHMNLLYYPLDTPFRIQAGCISTWEPFFNLMSVKGYDAVTD